MELPTVLLISDDAEFSSAVPARWLREARVPAFTLMTGDLCQSFDPEIFDIAIIGDLQSESLFRVVKILEASANPVIFARTFDLDANRLPPQAIVIPPGETQLDTLVLVASQILQRCEAVEFARRVAEAHASAEREATLGRYMLEMRHGVNNALTSVMGNAELLLLEKESLSPEVRLQVETIRNMSLRIHETMQRFSSLDKELNAVAKLTRMQAHASGA